MPRKMIAKFQNLLTELQSSLSLVESENVNTEAHENMFVFGFSEADAKALGVGGVESLLLQCRDIYASKISDSEKLYYCWLDEMAGQLRMSAISLVHSELPFRVKISNCSVTELVQAIVDYDSGTYTKGCLNVWQVGI